MEPPGAGSLECRVKSMRQSANALGNLAQLSGRLVRLELRNQALAAEPRNESGESRLCFLSL